MSGPWPRSARWGDAGLHIGGMDARGLAERYGTPLVVVDEEHVRERCRAFVEAFPRVVWAVKAFPAGGLIRIALEEGMGVLASTGGELQACLRAGARGERVLFHGNNKSEREIEQAVEAGVSLFIVDNEEELDRVAAAAERAGTRQRVLLRVAPGIDVETHAYVATGMQDTKFGIPQPLALRALKRALSLPELDVHGLHLHLGSQLLDPEPYRRAVGVALDLLAGASADLGFEARVLDIGGGMGVTYRQEEPVAPAELGSAVTAELAEACAARGLPVPQLIVEPGRAVTSNAAVTLYTVGTIKEVPGIRTFLAVDGGMSDNLRPSLYGSRYTMSIASRRSTAAPEPFTVVGRHCESGDILARDMDLPGDVTRGDLLAVASTGAYEYAMSSNYNKVGRPAVVLVAGGRDRLMLRREDDGDLGRLEVPSAPRPAAPRPEGVDIRPATPRDARSLIQMVAAVAAEGRFIRSEEVRWPRGELRRRLRGSWTPDRAEIVAVAGRRVVGHIGLSREAHAQQRHIASLGMAVAPGWRERGIGAALMSAAFDWARWSGIEKIALTVYTHNTRALSLYRRFGFAEEGRLVGHSKKSTGYEDEIVMGAWV